MPRLCSRRNKTASADVVAHQTLVQGSVVVALSYVSNINVPLNLLVGGDAAYLACSVTVLSVSPFQSSHSGGVVRYLIGSLIRFQY